MTASLACVNCGAVNLMVTVNRRQNVPVHYCSACGFFAAFGMAREMACAMLAVRLENGIVVGEAS